MVMPFPVIVACMSFGIINVASLEMTMSELSVFRMLCDVTESDIAVIYNIQIRRKANPASNKTWETLAEVETGSKPTLELENNKYLFASGFLDETTPNNSYLSLDMKTNKLSVMDDGTYRCELTYKSRITDSALTVSKQIVVSMADHKTLTKKQSDIQDCGDNKTALIVGVILRVTNVCTIVYGILITLSMRRMKHRREPSFQGEKQQPQIYMDPLEEHSGFPIEDSAQNEHYFSTE